MEQISSLPPDDFLFEPRGSVAVLCADEFLSRQQLVHRTKKEKGFDCAISKSAHFPAKAERRKMASERS